MDYKKLAQTHLETALSKGIIELENGEVKELRTSEILAVAKFVFKEGWISEEEVITTQSKNFPSEMFRSILGTESNIYTGEVGKYEGFRLTSDTPVNEEDKEE